MESALAANGYASAAKSTATPRGIEYRIFARITRNLTDAKSLSKKEFPKFAEAVHENLKLWTLLGADVAQEGNQLPVELRSQIFYLAEFARA
ncbi:MAG: flagellar biosynthesis regulator FlaF [Pseudomonadota bacterium]